MLTRQLDYAYTTAACSDLRFYRTSDMLSPSKISLLCARQPSHSYPYPRVSSLVLLLLFFLPLVLVIALLTPNSAWNETASCPCFLESPILNRSYRLFSLTLSLMNKWHLVTSFSIPTLWHWWRNGKGWYHLGLQQDRPAEPCRASRCYTPRQLIPRTECSLAPVARVIRHD